MLDWIQAESEWVFSGIGTTVVALLCSCVVGFYSWFRSNTRSQPISNVSAKNIKESATLVQSNWWQAHVDTVGAPTRNELLILLLDRYPKWSSKSYLRRSLKCTTQPLDDSIAELVAACYLKSLFRVFFKLSLSGTNKAKKITSKYKNASELADVPVPESRPKHMRPHPDFDRSLQAIAQLSSSVQKDARYKQLFEKVLANDGPVRARQVVHLLSNTTAQDVALRSIFDYYLAQGQLYEAETIIPGFSNSIAQDVARNKLVGHRIAR